MPSVTKHGGPDFNCFLSVKSTSEEGSERGHFSCIPQYFVISSQLDNQKFIYELINNYLSLKKKHSADL